MNQDESPTIEILEVSVIQGFAGTGYSSNGIEGGFDRCTGMGGGSSEM